jgi:hypothetical protein
MGNASELVGVTAHYIYSHKRPLRHFLEADWRKLKLPTTNLAAQHA